MLQVLMAGPSLPSCCRSAPPPCGCRKQRYGRASSRMATLQAMPSSPLLLRCRRLGALARLVHAIFHTVYMHERNQE